MTNQVVQESSQNGHTPDLLDQMLEVVHEVLGNPGLGPDDEVLDHGGTSLSVVRILTEASRRWSLTINPRDLDGVVTARSLARAAR